MQLSEDQIIDKKMQFFGNIAVEIHCYHRNMNLFAFPVVIMLYNESMNSLKYKDKIQNLSIE